jgi:hypothetical protein
MPSPFYALFERDLKQFQQELLTEVQAGDLSVQEAEYIESLIPDLHLPCLIILLALGTTTNRQEEPIAPFPLTNETLAEALDHLPATNRINKDDEKQAAQLLMTGQFFGDLADAFAAIAHVVPELPLDIAQDLRALPHLPKSLVLAIARDLGDVPTAIDAIVTDLRQDGTISAQPKLLSHTMHAIYQQATAKQLAATLHRLLGNDSVRLAIIIFARSKGLNLSQEDLDQVRQAINPDNPDLGVLLAPGYQRLRERFGDTEALALLEQCVAL